MPVGHPGMTTSPMRGSTTPATLVGPTRTTGGDGSLSDGVQFDRRGPGLLAWAPWIVIAAGVVIMAVLFVVAVSALTGGGPSSRPGEPPVRPGAVSAPTNLDLSSPSDSTQPSPPGEPSVTVSPSPSVTSGAPRPSATSAPPLAARGPVITGTYRAYGGTNSFVGELRIRNSSGAVRSWTATLSFPSQAGDLRSYWMDGAPKPSMTQSGNRYVFTGTADASASVTLKLQFRRSDGTPRPVECSISGSACAYG